MKLLISLLVTLVVTIQSPAPQRVADELLAADRAFSTASARTDLVTGISAMFASDVTMLGPGVIIYGAQQATEALRANPANAGAKAEWTPARAGISADGKHGFTAGFMTITRADGTIAPAKYMTYWERQQGGWRALAYKRGGAKAVPPVMPATYLLPRQIVTSVDASALERNRESLANAERSFSSDALSMGFSKAFEKYGSLEAMNLGGPDTPTFVMGNMAIAELVGNNEVNWGPDKTIIAPSGDFGVTIGYIHRNKPGADGKMTPANPFFTVWKRDSLSSPWRYIAE